MTLRTPAGVIRRVPAANGQVQFEETEKAGPYQVTAPAFERTFVAQLSDATESNLTQPAESMTLLSKGQETGVGHVKSSYSPWLLPVLPFLFLLEWLAFRRRKQREVTSL